MDKILCCKANTDWCEDSYTVSRWFHTWFIVNEESPYQFCTTVDHECNSHSS